MQASLYHLQLNVSKASVSLPFYKDLFTYFAYKIMDESPEHLGVSNGTTDFWIIETDSKYKHNLFHRKNTGLNHIAFRVTTQSDVDKFVDEFLKPKKLEALYNTPKLFPEYSKNYYAVYFEDPDKLKIEVVFK